MLASLSTCVSACGWNICRTELIEQRPSELSGPRPEVSTLGGERSWFEQLASVKSVNMGGSVIEGRSRSKG
jgi:hypothetical protein